MSARIDLLTWACETGPVTAAALAILHGTTPGSARARLAAAERGGFLASSRPLQGEGALYVPTRAGLRLCGLGGAPPVVPGPGIAHHAAVCAEVAARLQRAYPRGRVIGEAGLRSLERAHGRAVASAPLSHAAVGKAPLHRPDLVLWTDSSQHGPPVAIEVELTVKGAARLHAICRAWARAHHVAGVLYLLSPQSAAAVRAAVAQAHAEQRISLLPLQAICAASRPAASDVPELFTGPRSRAAVHEPIEHKPDDDEQPDQADHALGARRVRQRP